MPNTQGTAYLYGVSNTIANARVLSFSEDKAAANQASVPDEDGNIVSRHYDDLTRTGTITISYASAYTVPAGDGSEVIAWNGVTYEITAVNKAEEAQGHRRVTLSVLKSSNVASA